MYNGRGLGGNLPVSVSFTNLTTGNNQALKVGDKWAVEVHGSAGWIVAVRGTRNGQPYTFPAMGTIDGNGVFRLEGSALADQVGSWIQIWEVGGAHAGTLIFSIAPATAATPPPAPPKNEEEKSGYVDKETPPAQTFQMPDIPVWMWAIGAVGAAVLLGGRR